MNELYHHGVKGQRWGVRRYQYKDGTLTPLGEMVLQRYKNKQYKKQNRYHKRAANYERRELRDETNRYLKATKRKDWDAEDRHRRRVEKLVAEYDRTKEVQEIERRVLRNMTWDQMKEEQRIVGIDWVSTVLLQGHTKHHALRSQYRRSLAGVDYTFRIEDDRYL